MTSVAQRDHSTDHSHWWWFVLFSFALHTLLLLEWPATKATHPGGDRSHPIAVTLLSNSGQPPSENVHKDQLRQKEADTVKHENRHNQKRSPAVAEKIQPDLTALSRENINRIEAVREVQQRVAEDELSEPEKQVASTPTYSSPTTIEQQLLREIKIEFSRYFRYPPRALRKQLEGRVVLSFRLDGNGTIQNIVVTQSSGHGILDRAAIASLNKIPALDGVPPFGLSLELPIIYKIHHS